MGDPGAAGLQQFSRREVPDILRWLHRFSMFVAIVSTKYPQKAKELWAYQAIMISEARRCGGRGWSLMMLPFSSKSSPTSQVSGLCQNKPTPLLHDVLSI